MRLCARAGILDVERVLERLTPEQFDQWMAFEQLEGDPLDEVRKLLHRQMEALKLGFSAVCAAWGLEVKPGYFDVQPAKETAGSGKGQATKRDRRQRAGYDDDAQWVSPRQAAAMLQMSLAAAGVEMQRRDAT